MAVLMFIETVLVLDAAISQVAAEHFNGQQVLFRDREATLKEQLQMAEEVSDDFNTLARALGVAEIKLGVGVCES